MEFGFVDCHCHLSAREFNEDVEDVIQRSTEVGVKTLVAVTEEVGEFDRVLQLQGSYPGLVAPCFSLHPLQGGEGGEQRSVKPQIGLDFTPWCCPSQQDRDHQMDVFIKQLNISIKQLNISKELDLPVNVHLRSAAQVTIETMRQQGISRALLHNFAGRPSVALEGVKAGYLFFPPAVCRNHQLRNEPSSIVVSCR